MEALEATLAELGLSAAEIRQAEEDAAAKKEKKKKKEKKLAEQNGDGTAVNGVEHPPKPPPKPEPEPEPEEEELVVLLDPLEVSVPATWEGNYLACAVISICHLL
jgi:hypothetical protein